jgi:hypothetical protein
MADNSLTWIAAITIAAAGGISSHLGILYLAEKNTDIAWQKYGRFLGQRKSLHDLEEEIGKEAWSWPMYARPVFYTPIDQEAQVYFSNAQRSIYDARRLENSIKPPPPRSALLRPLLSLDYNWRRYTSCLNIQNSVSQFEMALDDIAKQLSALRQSHNREVALQENALADLEALEHKINEAGQRIKGQSRGKRFDENVDWSQKNSNNCYLEAQHQLTLETSDGINFAIADFFIKLGNYILNHFDLYEKEFSVPVRFELDHFEHHLSLFHRGISEMLTEPIDSWQRLHVTAHLFVLVNRQMKKSHHSLDVFLDKQQLLHGLEKQLQTVDFSKIVEETKEVEKECAYYWKPIDQDSSIWTKVLGSEPPPTVHLDEARSSYQGDILPLMGPDAVIKQSLMIKLIADMEDFFQRIGSAKINRMRLLEELNIHKQAQIEANIRLGPTGSAYLRIKELAPIESDTSVDIQRKCISCRKDFDVFQARARAVQGANFPQMLDELDAFENLCIHVKRQHLSLIAALKRQCFELAQGLISLQSELNRYVEYRPRIEYDVSETNNKITLSIKSYYPDNDSYTDLNTFLSQTRPVIASAQRDIAQLSKLWQKFEVAYADTTKVLLEMKQILDGYQSMSEQSWVWTQNAFTKALASARNSYIKHCREMEQIGTLDILVSQAVGMCQRLQGEVSRELKSVMSKLEPIQEKQEHLQNRYSELINTTYRSNMFSITPKNSDLIKQFCMLAVVADNADSASFNLELAQKVLEQSIPREEAVRIINNQGVYNENQNNYPGSTTYNAGNDINLFDN